MFSLATLAIVALLVCIALGFPIGLSLSLIGVAGLTLIGDLPRAMAQITLVMWDEGNKFLLLSLPLYVLMGNLIHHTGIARNLFRGMALWLSWLPGGLAIASVFASAGFGAVCGSSTATARTMGTIVIPEMRRHGYGLQLATGVLSSAGTLGILIPPSIVFVFYGIMTETSIGKLFIAGIIPGIMIAAIFALIIFAIATLKPSEVGRRDALMDVTWKERFVSLVHLLPVILIFGIILGGLYLGVFTPTEAAACGVVAVLIYGMLLRLLNWSAIRNALEDTALTSGMIYLILIGGTLFTRFLSQTGAMEAIIGYIISLNLGYFEFILLVTILYILLGCVLDLFGMLILTVPFLFPIVLALGIDPIWFGVYIVVIAEVALITPPVGINVYVIQSVAPDVPLSKIFRGCLPFVFGMLVFLALLAVFPEIALLLVA